MPIAPSEYGSFKLTSSIFLVFLFIVSTGVSFYIYLEQLCNRNGINKIVPKEEYKLVMKILNKQKILVGGLLSQ